jgi:hypothetical protein
MCITGKSPANLDENVVNLDKSGNLMNVDENSSNIDENVIKLDDSGNLINIDKNSSNVDENAMKLHVDDEHSQISMTHSLVFDVMVYWDYEDFSLKVILFYILTMFCL